MPVYNYVWVECKQSVHSNYQILYQGDVESERDHSVFWHWMWLEYGKTNTGFIYQIMKRTRHQYHYAVRRCKSNTSNSQKQRLADHIHNSTNFWREIKKINPANKLSTTIMDNANGDKEITSLLVNKYETLYSSVPTDDNEMNQVHLIINEGLVSQQLQGMVVTPPIIAQCIQQFKKGKGDGNYGFTSDHLIYGVHRLHVLLSILFNVMLQHGCIQCKGFNFVIYNIHS